MTATTRQPVRPASGGAKWGSYEDQGGQIRLACSGSEIEDWRVLPAVGWSAKTVIVDSGEMWAVLFREAAGIVVQGTCQDGRPVLRRLVEDRFAILIDGGEIVIEP